MANRVNTCIRQQDEVLNRKIETLYLVSSFVSSIYDTEKLLANIMEVAKEAVDAEASSLALYDPSDNLLHIEFASGDKDAELRNMTLEMGQGIMGAVALTRTPQKVDNVRDEPNFDGSIDLQTGFSTKSIIAVPIIRRDEILGVLEVVNKKGQHAHFTEEDTHLLEVVANQAALALENARLLEQTVANERLTTVGNMAASIIHDLKNPLMAIRGFSELLGKTNVPDEKRQTWGTVIVDEIDRINIMIQDILDFSRGKINLELDKVEIEEWLRKISATFVEELPLSNIKVVTEFNLRGTAWIDPERLRRVFVNIVGNARDAMRDSGDGVLMITSRADGSFWELLIQDNGPGIPLELRSKIFDRFVTSGKVGGTGLGLAIAHDIVDGHKGSISIHSKVQDEDGDASSGTTFIIRLPIEPQRKEAVPTA